MAESSRSGLLDLEKELTCSICTEILYQPLTLLDCLHTFCGSCSKLWFAWQAIQSKGRQRNPYTCPSCRASVRGTRPDAKITTLLDMYLQANPDKGKTVEEKAEIGEKYKPGDNVVPKPEIIDDNIEEQDRRMVDEVRAMSLMRAGRRGPREHERGTRHRSRDSRNRQIVSSNARHGSDNAVADSGVSRSYDQSIEHQPSLRSLISTSDSAEMEEEILRQIVEEGLLDGIDLHNMDVTQEDELSERIADAYRQRHMRSVGDPRSDERRNQSTAVPSQQNAGRRARSTSHTEQSVPSSHPPVSRPHLFEAYPVSHDQRRRTSSETRNDGRRQTAPIPTSSTVAQQATRSATDLSNRPRSSAVRERRPSDSTSQGRRSTDIRPLRPSEANRRISGEQDVRSRVSPSRISPSRISPIQGDMASPSATQTSSPTHLELPGLQSPRALESAINGGSLTAQAPQPTPERPKPSSSSSSAGVAARPRPTLYKEPSVSCDRCGRLEIQYDLHHNCTTCNGGRYNLCYRCHISGKGCLHWYGFGNVAWHRFQQRATPDQELPHALIGRQYLKPRQGTIQPSPGNERMTMTTEDPLGRLQSGAFCSICQSYADDCFWKCDTCNDGEWGFCNRCANQGKCCTHSLLPMAHVSQAGAKSPQSIGGVHSDAFFAPITSPSMIQAYPPSNLNSSGQYRPLSINTKCSICTYPIQPSQSRYHCYECNDGDYDICTSCYSKLLESGRITRENGDRGWRRCLRDHRMIMLYFSDSPMGQERIVVRDLVGGHFLKDEGSSVSDETEKGEWRWHDGEERKTKTISRRFVPRVVDTPEPSMPMLSKFPPDGGVGLCLLGIFTWLPNEGVTDELSFPRGAEIREALEISSEWYQGFYAGAKGLFPSNHVKVLGVVTM